MKTDWRKTLHAGDEIKVGGKHYIIAEIEFLPAFWLGKTRSPEAAKIVATNGEKFEIPLSKIS